MWILLNGIWKILKNWKFFLWKDDLNSLFINACENGDYITVSNLLNILKDFNIDIINDMGKSALHLAIENEHLEARI